MGTVAVGERNKMIDAWTGKATYTASAAVWAKLHVGDPGSAGTSNAATDTTRKQVTFANGAGSGTVASTAQVQWTNLATADPDVITWVSFWDASTNGTFLGADDLPSSKTVNDGDTLTIASGDISLSVS